MTTQPQNINWWQALQLRTVALGTLLVMLIVLGVSLLLQMGDVLVAVFLGILLATALRPIMNGLRLLRLPRAVAALVAVLLLVLAVVGLVVAVAPTIVEQGRGLTEDLPQLYSQTREALLTSRFRIVRQFALSIQPELSIGDRNNTGDLLSSGLEFLPAAGYALFITICTLLLTYYWLFQRDRSLRGVLLLAPSRYRESIETVWLQIEDKIGAFLRGQSILALVMALLSLVGFWLIGLPYALLLAVLAGLLELIPFLGPVITAFFAALVGFSVSPELGIAAIVVGLIAQQIENTFLVPRIMDQAVGVRPVVTLLALVGFAALFGIGGALLAIPLAAVAQVLFHYWLAQTANAPADAAVQGRDGLARLRYELQNLAQDVRMRLRTKDTAVAPGADISEEEIEQVVADLDELLQQAEQTQNNGQLA